MQKTRAASNHFVMTKKRLQMIKCEIICKTTCKRENPQKDIKTFAWVKNLGDSELPNKLYR